MTVITVLPHHGSGSVSIANQGNKRVAIDNRPSDMSMALIKRVHDSVKAGSILEPFTAKVVATWMVDNNIRKEDGTKYTEGYVATLLSNSYIGKINKTNRNSMCLDRRLNNRISLHEYWFVD